MDHSPSAPQTSLICAGTVVPMTGDVVFRDGYLLVQDGRIAAVGAGAYEAKGAQRIDLGPDAVLLPGLVNAHTHLELSDQRIASPPKSFVDWVIDLISQLKDRSDSDICQATRAGIAESLRFGVTTVGDISAFPHITREIIGTSALGGVSFGEVRAMARRRDRLTQQLKAAAATSFSNPRLTIGISPHAPYSVELAGYVQSVRANRPIATHLAETPDEKTFLESHTGSLRRIWDVLQAWDDHVPHFSGGPIRFAKEVGLLDVPAVLAHVNYCDDEELDLLARGRASVVYCPRTHAWFGHPPHRWRDMLHRGINVALGTDSRASSPDLNLLDDMRLLHRIAPDVPAKIIWEMGTIRGADALGLRHQCGSLEVGKFADMVAFTTATATARPLEDILTSSLAPTATWCSGQRVS